MNFEFYTAKFYICKNYLSFYLHACYASSSVKETVLHLVKQKKFSEMLQTWKDFNETLWFLFWFQESRILAQTEN